MIDTDSLKAIFEELLDEYHQADSAVTEERGNPAKDYPELEARIASFRQRFLTALGESQ